MSHEGNFVVLAAAAAAGWRGEFLRALARYGLLPFVRSMRTAAGAIPKTSALARRCSSRLAIARFWSSRNRYFITFVLSTSGSCRSSAAHSASPGSHAVMSTIHRSRPSGGAAGAGAAGGSGAGAAGGLGAGAGAGRFRPPESKNVCASSSVHASADSGTSRSSAR